MNHLKRILTHPSLVKTVSIHVMLMTVFVWLLDLNSGVLGSLGVVMSIAFATLTVWYRATRRIMNELDSLNVQLTQRDVERAAGLPAKKLYTQMPFEFGTFLSNANIEVRQLDSSLRNVRAEHHQLDVILSSLMDGVIAMDRHQKVLHINGAAKRLLQVDGDLLGVELWKNVRHPQINKIVDDVYAHRIMQRAEFSLAHSAGEIAAELLASSIVDERSTFLGVVLVIQDVSTQKQFERMRRDFVGNASHDLKTPIAAISAMAETMLDDEAMPNDVRNRFIEKIKRQTSRLSVLVQQLMTLSQVETVDPSQRLTMHTFDVCLLSEQLVTDLSPLLDKKKVSLHFDKPSHPIMLHADRDAIEQVLQNLLDNAIKYTEEGSVRLTLLPSDSEVVMSVSDTGDGISEQDQLRVFERFYRADKSRTREGVAPSGNGLGLSIVKHIVERHAGSIELQSALAKGSTFSVTLPLKQI
ncbi:MAG: ATP-binding protein [Pseudomonadota bacterium]